MSTTLNPNNGFGYTTFYLKSTKEKPIISVIKKGLEVRTPCTRASILLRTVQFYTLAIIIIKVSNVWSHKSKLSLCQITLNHFLIITTKYNIVAAHSNKIIINQISINVLYVNTGRFTFTTAQFPSCSNTLTVILKLKSANDWSTLNPSNYLTVVPFIEIWRFSLVCIGTELVFLWKLAFTYFKRFSYHKAWWYGMVFCMEYLDCQLERPKRQTLSWLTRESWPDAY